MSPRIDETTHPITVDTSSEGFDGCGKTDCGAWVTGVVLASESEAPQEDTKLRAYITCLGCTACPGPQFQSQDLMHSVRVSDQPVASSAEAVTAATPEITQRFQEVTDRILERQSNRPTRF